MTLRGRPFFVQSDINGYQLDDRGRVQAAVSQPASFGDFFAPPGACLQFSILVRLCEVGEYLQNDLGAWSQWTRRQQRG